jgi:hypothetical protein
MRNKSVAHHTLSSVFHDVGVPETLVMDGSKEQTLGQFRKKCRDALAPNGTIFPMAGSCRISYSGIEEEDQKGHDANRMS